MVQYLFIYLFIYLLIFYVITYNRIQRSGREVETHINNANRKLEKKIVRTGLRQLEVMKMKR
jgi:hypothetical protein